VLAQELWIHNTPQSHKSERLVGFIIYFNQVPSINAKKNSLNLKKFSHFSEKPGNYATDKSKFAKLTAKGAEQAPLNAHIKG
jgi:hypothetical protein